MAQSNTTIVLLRSQLFRWVLAATFHLAFVGSYAHGYYDPSDEEAVDRHNMCLQQASRGACNLDPVIMKDACAEVCSEKRFDGKDKLPQCQEAAKQGQCLTNMQNMWRDCPETCKSTKGIRKFEMVRLTTITGVTHDSFFELSATKADGKELYFDDFEGSITLVVNIAGMPEAEKTKQFYDELEIMKEKYPLDLEIVAFPFRLPHTPKDFVGYSHYSENIHIMEEAEVFQKPNIHPIYEYFKKIFGYEDLETEFPTWFLINSVGGIVEAHHGGDPSTVMPMVKNHIDYEIKGKSPRIPKRGSSEEL